MSSLPALTQFGMAVGRKLRRAQRIARYRGVGALLWIIADLLIQIILQPVERARWWLFRRVTRPADLSVDVLGHRMHLIADDDGISRELAVYRIHEPLTTKLLSLVLARGMRVIDIGSNIGYFLLLEARSVGSEGTVIGLEPEPENFRILLRNVQANGYTNVHLLPIAVGESAGFGELFISGKSNWHSLLAVPWKTLRRLPVRVVALDDIAAALSLSSIDLIRMDVEGYELPALRGMKGILAKFGPQLLVEFHPHLLDTAALDEFFGQLSARGYDVRFVADRRWDHPLYSWRLRLERMSLAELRSDPRITVERRTIAALFQRVRQDDAEHSGRGLEE